jgi:hypothetical protein
MLCGSFSEKILGRGKRTGFCIFASVFEGVLEKAGG